jgi:hypothetical protein
MMDDIARQIYCFSAQDPVFRLGRAVLPTPTSARAKNEKEPRH